MFAYLSGEIAEKGVNTVVIDVGGVGFTCAASTVTLSKLPDVGGRAKVHTYMSVREDAMDLFGFADKDELAAFKLLTSVSGVGPKMAISVLSELDFAALAISISSGDYKTLTRASGVGPKLAQRIVLELKDKIAQTAADAVFDTGSASPVISGSKDSEAVDALVALGFSSVDAKRAVGALNTKDMSVEDIIRIALKTVAR